MTPAAIDRYWELGRYPGNRDATIARFSQEMTTYTPQEVAAIHTPTLVMWGTDDPLLPFAGGEMVRRASAQCQARGLSRHWSLADGGSRRPQRRRSGEVCRRIGGTRGLSCRSVPVAARRRVTYPAPA